MKPPAFAYHRPETVGEALDLLAELGEEAKILAGGQSLVPLMNFRLAVPAHVVDVNGLTELTLSAQRGGVLRLGALTRHRELERSPLVAGAAPLLAAAAPFIGHPQIRSMGTLGGSLSHADPSAELPGCVLALDATVVAASARGERRIPAGEFFASHFTTTLESDELLVAVEVPVPAGRVGCAFTEVAARHGDFALAGAAAVVTLDDAGVVTDARVVCAAVAPTPVRVAAAEKLLTAGLPGGLTEVETAVQDSLDPTPELKVSARYKRRTAGVLARRAVEAALADAEGRAA
ncbi:xanthine dehydrogenase family protein subunit M [Actinomycetospora sp. TBRC 11914]|uniref:FAD binding domain-containing protein n=1 Tax=Actinomycetospora sp. TBRC 11914 TaxID=2729387 RepID=UPI00145D22AB|nr:xanthine dehydrogenase family protein subunit M [Actinomycetospora sp. TBRC 11914]NMO89487.1 xanthine dehydrogenase family protein subunit M [Actinomycetospora sp. TBRC 11914]